ncbi:chemokine (C-C motif) ligand 34a, duplicate 4 [Paramisgurnus dabryanus]|uniref:chemokine (C-C motif) ligand 34a, duplicate 4 n=1 Tax=Paramisgurnus dabryanus TaxID=90735 RepID=UPI0031F3B10D
MQFNQKMMMMKFAVIAVIMSVMIMGTNQKTIKLDVSVDCCTSVSTTEITSPITGFKLQKRNLPCVNAVIFYTDEGMHCSHWKESWVKQKVQELKRLQLKETGIKINSTVSTPLVKMNSTISTLLMKTSSKV